MAPLPTANVTVSSIVMVVESAYGRTCHAEIGIANP